MASSTTLYALPSVKCSRYIHSLLQHLNISLTIVTKDYQTLLSQLEHAFNTSTQFSLQKLWFYVHPTIHTLSLLYQLVQELGSADDPGGDSSSSSSSSEDSDPEEAARNEALGLGGANLKAVLSEIDKSAGLDNASGIPVKGGEVLTIIFERMQNMSGDPTARTLYSSLLKDAGIPYVSMIKMWITTGRLVDPHEELLVKENKYLNRGILDMDYTDEYWDRRYTVMTCFSIL
jgi:gamma-tubulin complex component 2